MAGYQTPQMKQLQKTLKERRARALNNSTGRLTRVKILCPIGKGPYTLWVWGSYPLPLGNVVGLELRAWNNAGNKLNIIMPPMNPLPDFALYIQEEIQKYWVGMMKASMLGKINPQSGYKKAVEVTHLIRGTK